MIQKSIIREIRVIRLIRDSDKASEQTQGYYKNEQQPET